MVAILETTFPNCFSCMNNVTEFVPNGPVNKPPTLVQLMAWHRRGDKQLLELMMAKVTDAYLQYPASMT